MTIKWVASQLDSLAMAFPTYKMCYEQESPYKRIAGLATIVLSQQVASRVASNFFTEDAMAPQAERSSLRVFFGEVCKVGAVIVTAHSTYKLMTFLFPKNAYLGRAALLGAFEGLASSLLKHALQTIFFREQVASLSKAQKDWKEFFVKHESFFDKRGHNKQAWTQDVLKLLQETSSLIDKIFADPKILSSEKHDLKLLESAYWIQHVLDPKNVVDEHAKKIALTELEDVEREVFSGLNDLQDLPEEHTQRLTFLKHKYSLLVDIDHHFKNIEDEKIKKVIESTAETFENNLKIGPEVGLMSSCMNFFGEPFISSKLISRYPSFFSTPILMSAVTRIVLDVFEQFISYKICFPSLNELPKLEDVEAALEPLKEIKSQFKRMNLVESVRLSMREMINQVSQ